jgi:hypothetical protein
MAAQLDHQQQLRRQLAADVVLFLLLYFVFALAERKNETHIWTGVPCCRRQSSFRRRDRASGVNEEQAS